MSRKKKPEVLTGEVIASNKTQPLVKIDDLSRGLANVLPKWVAEKEDVGNAMYKTAQEIWLVFEDALIKHHGFDEAQLNQLRNQIRPVLEGVAEYEEKGLSLLTPFSIDVVSDLVNTHVTKEKLNRMDMEYPTKIGAAPYIKALKERNHDK